MIEQILPGGVATAEAYEDPPGLVPHPAEEALISRAVEKRRREFVTTRHLARQAMGKLGVPSAAVLRGERGAPLWPQGVVGSLAHCDGYRGAVLAYSMQVRSLGIDAEPNGPLPNGVLPAVSIEAERRWLSTQSSDGPVHWDRVLFCAKEATYKAWFPLTGRWLGFEDAHITFAAESATSGTFRSQLLVPGDTPSGAPLASFDGRWLVAGGLILTAISVQ